MVTSIASKSVQGVCKFIFYTYVEFLYIVLFCLTWPIQILILLFKILNYKSQVEKKHLQAVLKRKKSERKFMFSNMKKIFGNGTCEHRLITSLPVEILQSKLQSRKLSALEVTVAYIAKALEDTEKYNSVTEFLPDAISIAKTLDELPVVKDPLHGLPICIKDDTDVEGVDSTLGYIKNLYKPAKESATIVKVLKELGAIPIAKTNVPQAILSNGSSNPIFGQTQNPLRRGMSPAGSSSGTASLVASGGAVFGTGTCFGGSLAMPAHFCGVSSLKPSFGRLSSSRVNRCIPCPTAVSPTSPGFIAKRPSILATVFKHVIKNKSRAYRDLTCPPIKWKEHVFASKDKLRIGYFTSLPIFPSFDDTKNTVLRAKLALEEAGHTLIPFEMPDSFQIAKLKGDITFVDEGKHILKMLENEEISKDFFPLWFQLRYLPKWYQRLKSYFYSTLYYPNSPASKRKVIQTITGNLKSSDMWESLIKVEAIRDDILNKMKEDQLDLILSPVAAYPSLTFEGNQVGSIFGSYTCVWNLINFPTGVVPFGIEAGNGIDSYNTESDQMLAFVKNEMQYSIGMPIGLQIISKPFHEENVLRLMCELDSISNR